MVEINDRFSINTGPLRRELLQSSQTIMQKKEGNNMILLLKILLRYTYNVGGVIMIMVAICDFIQGDVP